MLTVSSFYVFGSMQQIKLTAFWAHANIAYRIATIDSIRKTMKHKKTQT